jgi:hypothetical protein
MNSLVAVLLVLLILAPGSKSFVPLVSLTSRSRTRTIFATKMTEDLQVLTGIRDIADQYDTFLLDMWYVHTFLLFG